jgi:hypothetical protein
MGLFGPHLGAKLLKNSKFPDTAGAANIIKHLPILAFAILRPASAVFSDFCCTSVLRAHLAPAL